MEDKELKQVLSQVDEIEQNVDVPDMSEKIKRLALTPAPKKGQVLGAKKWIKYVAVALAVVIIGGVGLYLFGDQNPDEGKLTSAMLKDCRVDLEGVEAMGIMEGKPTSSDAKFAGGSSQLNNNDNKNDKPNYFVAFDEGGNIEEVVFINETTGKEITQDKLPAWIYKMHIYKNFVYMSYTDNSYYSSDPHYSDPTMYYYCSSDIQSFVMDTDTGKVYSLSDFLVIHQIAGNVIESNNECYEMSVENDELKFTTLINNANIYIREIFIDKFDRVFIINSSQDHISGNIIYRKYVNGAEYVLGSDGLMYRVEVSNYNKMLLEYFNDNGILVKAGNENNAVIHGSYAGYLSYFIVAIIKNGLFIEVTQADVSVYAFNTERDGKSMSGLYWGKFYINGELIANVGQENGDDQLIHFKLNEITMEAFISEVSLEEIIPQTPLDIINAKSFEVENDTLVASVEKIGGTQKYRISYDGTKMVVEEYAPIVYETKIITIQPLN